MAKEYLVTLRFDEDAGVWYTDTDDVPGLSLEDASVDALFGKVRAAVPELLTLNAAPRAEPFESVVARPVLHLHTEYRELIAIG